jgi:hypothetical protein
MQYGGAIAYALRQLRHHTEHYCTHDLELLAVIHVLKVWRNNFCLHGSQESEIFIHSA